MILKNIFINKITIKTISNKIIKMIKNSFDKNHNIFKILKFRLKFILEDQLNKLIMFTNKIKTNLEKLMAKVGLPIICFFKTIIFIRLIRSIIINRNLIMNSYLVEYLELDEELNIFFNIDYFNIYISIPIIKDNLYELIIVLGFIIIILSLFIVIFFNIILPSFFYITKWLVKKSNSLGENYISAKLVINLIIILRLLLALISFIVTYYILLDIFQSSIRKSFANNPVPEMPEIIKNLPWWKEDRFNSYMTQKISFITWRDLPQEDRVIFLRQQFRRWRLDEDLHPLTVVKFSNTIARYEYTTSSYTHKELMEYIDNQFSRLKLLQLENYLKNHSFSREKPFLKNVRYPLEWPWVTPQDTKTISYQIEYLM